MRNILINIGAGNDSIFKIKFHKKDNKEIITFINKNYEEYYNDKIDNSDSNKFFVGISVDNFGNIKINKSQRTEINVDGDNEFIEDLLVDIIVIDRFDNTGKSIGLKDYFSLFDIRNIIKSNIDYTISNSFYIKNIDKYVLNGEILTLNRNINKDSRENKTEFSFVVPRVYLGTRDSVCKGTNEFVLYKEDFDPIMNIFSNSPKGASLLF